MPPLSPRREIDPKGAGKDEPKRSKVGEICEVGEKSEHGVKGGVNWS